MAAPTIDSVTAALHGDAPLDATITVTATDPDAAGTVSVAVNWGDGTVTTQDSGVQHTHTYTLPGAWQVTITATDADGETTTEIRYAAAELADTSNTLADSDTGLCVDWFDSNDDVFVCDVALDADDTMMEPSIAAAQRWFHDATCHQFPGVCTATVRPDPTEGCAPIWESATGYPIADISQRTRSDAYQRNMIDLTDGLGTFPIRSITEVVVDGEVVDPAFYTLVNQRWLEPREVGNAENPLIPWPNQYPRKPVGSVGTWYITLTYGREAPPLLVQAAAKLACELWKQAIGADCEIPDNATSITREGVTVSFPQPEQNRWGIAIIDRALDLYGCKRPSVPRFYDPAADITPVTRS